MGIRSKTTIATMIIASSVLLSGCGLFGGEEPVQEIDPPQDVTYLEEGVALNPESSEDVVEEITETDSENQEVATEVGMRELYLIDKNGYVVPQSISIPKAEGVAKQALEYLVQNGPVTPLLPDGFRGVIPPDTQVLGVNLLEDGTIVADFSKEFVNYRQEDELKILQAITWTLTQFDSVNKVKIQINGYEQDVMPVNGTPIEEGVSRADGINFDSSEVVDIRNTSSVTLYFMGQNSKGIYYVPVTKRVEKTEKDPLLTVVNQLIQGPTYTSNLFNGFQPEVKLLDNPIYENGVVRLNFNEAIFGNLEGDMILKSVLDTLVLSLTEQTGIESVAITVNGNSNIVSEEGQSLSEPVTRPENVNTGSF